MDDLDLPGMSADLLYSYARANQFGRDVRVQSLRDQPEGIEGWLSAIRLLTQTFARHYNSGASEADSLENQAYWTRVSLLMLAGRGSKAALDLTLMGFHTEAMTLLRSMLDGWARAVYVRVVPAAAEHWIEDLYGDPSTKAPNWRNIEEAVCLNGRAEDRKRFDQALVYWRLLNDGAHPSGVGIMQSLDTNSGMRTFLPEYNERRLRVTLSLAAFVHLCLFEEISAIAGHSEWWQEQWARFRTHARQVAAHLRPILRHEMAVIQAERAARPNDLSRCIRSRWVTSPDQSGPPRHPTSMRKSPTQSASRSLPGALVELDGFPLAEAIRTSRPSACRVGSTFQGMSGLRRGATTRPMLSRASQRVPRHHSSPLSKFH